MPEVPNRSLMPTRTSGVGRLLGQEFRHGPAEAADDGVLLGSDDGAGLQGRVQEQVPVKGLDGGHVEHPGADPLLLQPLGGDEGLGSHEAGGHEGQVGPVNEDLSLADLEPVGVVEDGGDLVPPQPEVDRPAGSRPRPGRRPRSPRRRQVR